jgi:glycosyltransferase involved in cell wall biosynthesis
VTSPTVVIAMHDGFYSCGTGAGRSNRAFLETAVKALDPRVRLVVLPVHLVPASSEYNRDWHATMHALLQRAGGQVIPVSNGSGGYVRFGGLDAFAQACSSAAEAINRHLLPAAGPILVVAFDTPFYGLGRLLTPPARANLIVVARSTAALHAPDDLARIAWEHDGLHATTTGGGRVAAISAHMRNHLITGYHLSPQAVIDLPNGLTVADWQHIPPLSTELLPPAARRGFMLSMGRAVPYKGFDDLLDALGLLKKISADAAVPHAVVAAVTDDPHPGPYQQHLARRIATEGLNVTLLTRFAHQLRSLLIHPALAAVVVPSRAEPFGRIPLEAFVAGAAPVVATTAGGLAELVIDEQTGFSAEPHHPESLAEAIRKALQCNPRDRARLRANGRRLAASRYNYEHTVVSFLTDNAPWAATEAALQARRSRGPAVHSSDTDTSRWALAISRRIRARRGRVRADPTCARRPGRPPWPGRPRVRPNRELQAPPEENTSAAGRSALRRDRVGGVRNPRSGPPCAPARMGNGAAGAPPDSRGRQPARHGPGFPRTPPGSRCRPCRRRSAPDYRPAG